MEESFSFFVKKAVRDRWSVCQVFFLRAPVLFQTPSKDDVRDGAV